MLISGLRQALRTLLLRQNRGYSASSILMFALGIAAVTTIFSVLYAVLLAPLPYRDPYRLLSLAESRPSSGIDLFSVSGPNYLSWTERTHSFSGLSAYLDGNVNLNGRDGAMRLASAAVTPNLWRVLGTPLVAGRTFSQIEDSRNSGVVIIGEDLWRRRFGGDTAVLGRTLRIDGSPRVVIGIAPRETALSNDAQIWLPLALRDATEGRGDKRLNVIGRLAPAVSRTAADADMRAIASDLAARFPDDNRDWTVETVPVRDWIVGAPMRARVLTLTLAVLLLLLVACINIANLQIARATQREREIGVRQALGATRARLMRQIVAECLVLAAIGGVLGIALGAAAIRVTAHLLGASVPRLESLTLVWPVALVALAITALTALVCGLAPAAVAARSKATIALHNIGRSATDAPRTPLREALIVAQFALATLLVIASVLLVQQFRSIQANALGFTPQHVLTARITLPDDDNGTNYRRNREAYERLLGEVRGIPGVERVGLGSEIPLGQLNTTSMAVAVGASAAEARSTGIQTAWRVVTADFLDALEVPLLRGRNFAASGEASHSMLMSAGLVRRLWPRGDDPLGRRVTLSNGQTYNIVGVVGDVRQSDRAGDPTPSVYMPTTWITLSTMTLALRTHGDPTVSIGAVREAARRAIPGHPLFDIRTLSDVAAANVAEPRAQTAVVALFGAVSLLLAAIGVAGLTAFLIARRTPELAVRMALGASTWRIVLHVMSRGGMLCVTGIVTGCALAIALARGVNSMAFALQVNIEPSLVGTAVCLSAIGLVACWIPARRAAAISPSLALRGE
ncbi:MAG: ABC transporter permease [Rhodanobacteraceae bacterium]